MAKSSGRNGFDFGGAELSPEELKSMKEESDVLKEMHEKESLLQEASEAKKERTIPMKIKRFLGREAEQAKAIKAGFEAGATPEMAEKTPEFYPEKTKEYYAPTKGLSKRLFGFTREAKKDITKAGEIGKAIGEDIGKIAKEAKEAESFLGGPSKGTAEGGFFSGKGTMFEKSAGISGPAKESFFSGGSFMSAEGTMFAKAGPTAVAGVAKPRKAHRKRKHKKHRSHKLSSDKYVLVRMPKKTASYLLPHLKKEHPKTSKRLKTL